MYTDKTGFGRAVLFALSISLSPAACFAQTGTIVIDASQTVALSDSGDDLATLQNIFQDANAPQDGAVAPALALLIADLKMKRMRLLQADNYCDIDSNGNFGMVPLDQISSGNYIPGTIAPGDCLTFLWQLQPALDNHLTPHVAIGATLPVSALRSRRDVDAGNHGAL